MSNQALLRTASINDIRIRNVYVDGGAPINVISEQTMKEVGLKPNAPSLYKMKMADTLRVKSSGAITAVRVVYNATRLRNKKQINSNKKSN